MNQADLHYGVIGMGPVGSVFAVLLQNAGHRVTVHCNEPAKAETLRHKPLSLHGKVTASTRLAGVTTDWGSFCATRPDVVLVCTKACFNHEIAGCLRSAGLPDLTTVVACQNGIGAEDALAEVLGPERVARIILNIGCSHTAPDMIRTSFLFDFIISGTGRPAAREARIAADLTAAGLATSPKEDYRQDVFRKAVLNTALGSVCAITHMNMDEVMGDPELRRMVREIAREAVVLARALNYRFDDGFIDEALAYLDHGGPHRPSIALDLDLGRPTENEFHAGALYRLAAKHLVEVPVTQTLYYLIKHLERKMRSRHAGGTATESPRAGTKSPDGRTGEG